MTQFDCELRYPSSQRTNRHSSIVKAKSKQHIHSTEKKLHKGKDLLIGRRKKSEDPTLIA